MGLTLLEIQALTASLAANGRVPSTVTPPAATSNINGVIPAAGATQTAGSGFTYTHTNGTGVYVFTFATPFASVPAIVATLGPESEGTLGPGRQLACTAASVNGFTIETDNGAAVGEDHAFMFIAFVA